MLGLVAAIMLVCAVPVASAEEYAGIAGLKTAKVVFDERESSPKTAVLHLKLVHQTYKDFAAMKKDPAFVVIFMGPAVKLISKNREGYSPDERKALDEIAGTISAMSKDGIKSEMCLVAAKVFDVDPTSVLPEIKPVGNGWISMVVRQSEGYSVVPVY